MEYNQLGNTGILVSELCFGTMTFGGRGFWEAIGKVPQDEVNKLMKTALDGGINFIDTANAYSEGLSEKMLGKSLTDLGINRQQVVIATKVRIRMGPGANQVGLTRAHIIDSVNDSLERMGLSYVDLLYIHGVDPLTPLEETMRGLEDVVRAGKVRYIGISNHPAWMVTKANAIAEKNGWTPFCAGQYYYSLASRDIERELIPMIEDQGMGLMPWSPLAGGFLSGKYTREKEKAGDSRRDDFDFPPLNKEKAFDIIDVMLKIAKNHQVSAAQIALAWMLRKPAVTSIIIGAKKPDQLNDNLASTQLQLTEDEINQLDEISALTPEYPGWMVQRQMQDRLPNQ
ncbi:aldo/keto reductase [Sunxiuqinia indica]|uniref:aldo/keto reductase n=1 Tax=Sunxiuqinia indica TaxID=2692584 RepID=UPI00135A97BD|nr:aldo/keto reductase [Sunxiuqinia indica]